MKDKKDKREDKTKYETVAQTVKRISHLTKIPRAELRANKSVQLVGQFTVV